MVPEFFKIEPYSLLIVITYAVKELLEFNIEGSVLIITVRVLDNSIEII